MIMMPLFPPLPTVDIRNGNTQENAQTTRRPVGFKIAASENMFAFLSINVCRFLLDPVIVLVLRALFNLFLSSTTVFLDQ